MQILAAIQLLPSGNEKAHRYAIIDKAIALIQKSGLKCKVCPFETVVEGEPKAIYDLIETIRIESLKDCSDIIVNIKLEAANTDLEFEEKLVKY